MKNEGSIFRGNPFEDIADYPKGAFFDEGMVHITGCESMYLENCKGILSLSENKVVFRMRRMTVTVEGTQLSVGSFSSRGISLQGKIGFVSLQRERQQ